MCSIYAFLEVWKEKETGQWCGFQKIDKTVSISLVRSSRPETTTMCKSILSLLTHGSMAKYLKKSLEVNVFSILSSCVLCTLNMWAMKNEKFENVLKMSWFLHESSSSLIGHDGHKIH